MQLRSKLPDIGTTIFTVMSKLAVENNAINLSQGFPGFDCDPKLSELVTHHMKRGANQYAPMIGIPALRERIAEKTASIQGVKIDPEQEVTVVSGATEGLYSAIAAVLYTGDEAIILEPAYDSYIPAIRLNGGVPVSVGLDLPNYSVNWEKVKAAVTEKTRLIIVNTPHNPSGYVWTKEDISQLSALIADKNIFVISDEVYEHITFDNRPHISLLSDPILRERTFVCGSFGKTFHVTGWKLGFCIAPKNLSAELRKVHQYLTFSTATPLQYALADYLLEPAHYLELPEFYQKKRDFFCEGLRNTSLKFTPCEGSFFQQVSYQGLTEEKDFDLAVRLTEEFGVASIPVSSFYATKEDHKVLRFCFAKENSELEEGINRLIKWSSSI